MNVLDPISTIMTKDVLTVSPEDKLQEAQIIFDQHKIHHLPVVDNEGRVLGMLSVTDLHYFLRGKSINSYEIILNDIRLKNYKVEEIMTKGLAKISSTDRILTALKIFKENLFHAMPIVDDNRLVGIITTHDIIATLANEKLTTP